MGICDVRQAFSASAVGPGDSLRLVTWSDRGTPAPRSTERRRFGARLVAAVAFRLPIAIETAKVVITFSVKLDISELYRPDLRQPRRGR